MTREQKALLYRLVIRSMWLKQRNDEVAREAWARRVREAFPYGRDVLTVKLGELVERRESA